MEKKIKRNYQNKLPSVTTVLRVLRKPGLENWFKYNTAKFCNEESNKGKLIGSQIHDAIQSYIETGEAKIDTEHGDEVTNALKSFISFKKVHPHINMQRAEIALTSNQYQYNGTIDCIGDGIILDWKSAKCRKEKPYPDIYDEYKYQVSAYWYLYNEHNEKKIDKAIIVAVAKDKVSFSTYEMDVDELSECFMKVFLPCLSIYNYQRRK